MKPCLAGAFTFAAVLLGAAPVCAQSQEQGLSLGFGVGLAPSFVGADSYEVVPLPSLEYRSERFSIRSNNLGLEATLLETGGVGFGTIVRLDAGRNDLFEIDDPVLRRLRRVDQSLEIGSFVELAHPFGDSGSVLVARASAVRGLSGGHEGVLVEASAGVIRPMGDAWTMGSFFTLTAQSDAYADAYFSVDAADAAASGLPRFAADGGLRDVGLAIFATRQMSERLSLTATAAYSRLIGDAADSPIVRERGDDGQGFVGVAFTYSMGKNR